jgi:hypothetical protein
MEQMDIEFAISDGYTGRMIYEMSKTKSKRKFIQRPINAGANRKLTQSKTFKARYTT